METTLTMAGHMAHAGVARLRVVAPVASSMACRPAAAPAASYGATVHQASGSHQITSWISGALAKPATFMVFTRKNRPTRPLSELSP